MMEVVQTCLSANKYRQGTFHYCGGPVKRVLTCFSADMVRESSFHRGTSLVKHVHTAKTTKSHVFNQKCMIFIPTSFIYTYGIWTERVWLSMTSQWRSQTRAHPGLGPGISVRKTGFTKFTQLHVVTSPLVMFISCAHCARGSKMELDPDWQTLHNWSDFRIWTRFLRKYVYSRVIRLDFNPWANADLL